jgi:hypothetical protein
MAQISISLVLVGRLDDLDHLDGTGRGSKRILVHLAIGKWQTDRMGSIPLFEYPFDGVRGKRKA